MVYVVLKEVVYEKIWNRDFANMSSVTRLKFKMMMDSWCTFNTSIESSVYALNANKVEKFSNLKQLVHENFFRFDKDFRIYKSDIIEKAAKSEDIFNGSAADERSGKIVPNYQHNDVWANLQMARYTDITELLEDGLEAGECEIRTKSSQTNNDLLIILADSEFNDIESKVKMLYDETIELTNNFITLESKSDFDAEIEMLTYRLTVYLTEKVRSVVNCTEALSNDNENILFKLERFLVSQQDILNWCTYLLNSKLKTDKTPNLEPTFSVFDTTVHQLIVPKPSEKIFLK